MTHRKSLAHHGFLAVRRRAKRRRPDRFLLARAPGAEPIRAPNGRPRPPARGRRASRDERCAMTYPTLPGQGPRRNVPRPSGVWAGGSGGERKTACWRSRHMLICDAFLALLMPAVFLACNCIGKMYLEGRKPSDVPLDRPVWTAAAPSSTGNDKTTKGVVNTWERKGVLVVRQRGSSPRDRMAREDRLQLSVEGASAGAPPGRGPPG